MTPLMLQGGSVFDGTGAEPRAADILFKNGFVSAIGPGLATGSLTPDQIIDCSGKTVIPGLIDCHVHFMLGGVFNAASHSQTPFSYNFYSAAQRMRDTLKAGVTTVREAGGADLGLKEAQQSGLISGPRMQISITILSQTGGHWDSWEVCGANMPSVLDSHPGRPHNQVDGPEEVRKKVRELIRSGADVIKVCTSGGVISHRDDPRHGHFRDDELAILVAEANAAHVFVMAHAQSNDGIKSALRAGMRSIEHGIYLDDEAIQMMLDSGTYLVPTLSAPRGILDAAEEGVEIPSYVIDKTEEVIEHHWGSARRAIEAGVKIATGSDSGVTPHGQNLRELAYMAQLGMSDADVLLASTQVAAELMGMEDEVGSLVVGRRADAVVLEGVSLNVADLQPRIDRVFQNGQEIGRD